MEFSARARDMKCLISEAFLQVRSGFSTDRVLADPDLNAAFVSACREQGLDESPEKLNRQLLNIRKAGKLGKLQSKPTQFDDEEYSFAAEIAVRHLERREQITLDDILVDPSLAKQFDAICEDIAPGFSPLRYRWAALRLRKSRKLTPEIISHAVPSSDVSIIDVSTLKIDEIPSKPGIYCFMSDKETLYVGEAKSLRSRLKKHLNHSDNRFLARWIWEHGIGILTIELHLLGEDVKTKVRKALETEMIRSRKPLFNVLGKLDE